MILQQAGRQAVRQGQFVGPYVIVVAVNDDDVDSNDYFTFFFSLALISHSSKLLFFVCIGISVVCMYVLMWHVSGYTVETPVLLCVCSWNAHLFVLCNILFLCRLEQRSRSELEGSTSLLTPVLCIISAEKLLETKLRQHVEAANAVEVDEQRQE